MRQDRKDNRVTFIHAEEGEGLDGLISVAEAFERSQQPDFNDIASPVIDGTDTEKFLVKTCVLCSKALLGRNALGRHMKNAHPAVFGPYTCPFTDCRKLIDSGVKMISHMASHTSVHETANKENACCTCNIGFETSAKLQDHVKSAHGGEQSSNYKPIFVCSAGDDNCKAVFNAARHFTTHMKTIHNLKPWKCEICDKRFVQKQNYQDHALSHGDSKKFTCDICTKVFNTPRKLYAHRELSEKCYYDTYWYLVAIYADVIYVKNLLHKKRDKSLQFDNSRSQISTLGPEVPLPTVWIQSKVCLQP